jgi:hypothetical protein
MKIHDPLKVASTLMGQNIELSDRCCGEAGTFAVSRPDIATQVRYRKQEQIKKGPLVDDVECYHSLAESKIAPMLVTGSYAGWLLKVISQYLEAGRLSQIRFYPYLTDVTHPS